MSYTQYYSSSDVFIYLLGGGKTLHLDKANGIGFAESLDSFPTYGLGDSEFAFINQGNVIVNGYIDVNLIHTDYINKTIEYLFSDTNIDNKAARKLTLKDLRDMSVAELEAFAMGGSSLGKSRKLQGIKRGFTINVIFNNTTPLRPDISPSSIVFYECVMLDNGIQVASENDGQIVNRYRFAAKRK